MISYLKLDKDSSSFNYAKRLGFPIYEVSDVEKVDEKIKELKNKNYTSVVISNELAGFSQDIIKKYSDDITIFPGHGEDSTLGYEKKNNIFLNE